MKINRSYLLLSRLFLLWLLLHITATIMYGLQDQNQRADIALILANKVNADVSLSNGLAKRMECGLQVYRQGRVKKIIVSGGLGKEGFYEGDKMRDFLLENGVPDSVIIVDNQSTNTRESVKNTLALRDHLHFQSVLVVSQYFHLMRAKLLFGKAGFEQVSGTAPRYFELRDVYSLVREIFAFYQQIF